MNHVFEECHIFLAHQTLPGPMNVAFARPTNNLYLQTDNPDWRNHPNFSWVQNTNDQPRPIFSNNFQPSHYQHNFPNQAPQSSLQSLTIDKKSTNLEKILTSFMQNTGQVISRLEGQMSQLINFISEWPKWTFPNQPVTNPRNYSQAHMVQEDPMNQYNVIHTMRSKDKLIIKCQHHRTQHKHPLLLAPLHPT